MEPVILLMGRRDHPTDGVVDYCEKLREAGAQNGLSFESVQVPWAEKGWRTALAELRESAAAWRDRWVLLQYTTLAWSRRGFPLRAPRVLDVLRQCGARPGVVLHDFSALEGKGIVGGVREYCHLRVLRQLYSRSDIAIFTIPVKNISWLPAHHEKAVFAPVGANCPELSPDARPAHHDIKTVAVYSVTGGAHILPEVADIDYVLRQASKAGRLIRLIVFGRGSREAENALRSALAGANIEIEVQGLISPEQVTETLARADVLLFVRGHISSRRGSAIAGIACGLPIVCYSGPDTDWPITEAGILAVPLGDRQALAVALESVLSDSLLQKTLSEQSRNAQEKYFSWAAITARFAEEMRSRPEIPAKDEAGHAQKEKFLAPGDPHFGVPKHINSNDDCRRVLVVSSHVVQYSSPVYRKLALDSRVDLLVSYCSMQGAEPGVDPGFGIKVSWDMPLLDGYKWKNVRNRALRPGLGHFFGLFNPGLWSLIRDGNFDAVLITGYSYASAWIAIMAAKWYGIPILFNTDAQGLRSLALRAEWKLRIKRILVPHIYSLAKVVLPLSSGGVEYLRMLGFPSDRIVLTPYVVDNDWWAEQAAKVDRIAVRAEWRIPNHGSVALFCAKLQPWKEPLDLLEAFARAKVPDSYLVFAGDGPLRNDLVGRAEALGVTDRVRFLGFVNQSQLPSVYCASDLLVLPSQYDAFGLVVNEAMICGRPVVVSDCVGARFDLVRQGENGYVFPVGDVDALAAVLQDIMPDLAKQQRMGAAARLRMETWSPREFADSIVRALRLAAADATEYTGRRRERSVHRDKIE